MMGAHALVEIAPMLVLSTGHLTNETCNKWMVDNDIGYDKDSIGWFVYVNQRVELPGDLNACLNLAASLGCLWVMFDCDGPEHPDLPVYEW